MASKRPMPNRAPPTIRAHPVEHSTLPAAQLAHARLDAMLERRQAFRRAQGMLAEIANCTATRAGKVLLQVGAQLGFQTADSVSEFFVIAAIGNRGGPEAQAFIRRAASSTASPADVDAASPADVANRRSRHQTVVDATAADAFITAIAGGRGLAIHGELDLATSPLVEAAFATHPVRRGPGNIFWLDLQDMTFVDVGGVRALSEIASQVIDTGYRLRVTPPSSRGAQRMLRLAVRHGWLTPAFAQHFES